MYALDSRSMGPLDCFVQKITESGDFIFEIRGAAAGFCPLDEKAAARIKVKANKVSRAQQRTSGKQHHVPVIFNKGVFEAVSPPKELMQGDAILFHPSDPDLPSFSVVGRMGKTEFSSTELRDQTVFSHPFGLPGKYHWADANGSGVGGVIVVENEPATGKEGAERAMQRMAEGVLVHIIGDKVKPQELHIATGQTVFFAVEQTDGITITDVTLLGRGKKAR
ncbi:hypothetical protein [Profundibacter sp.]